ncbi:papilin [Culex quinquefasciatus]|uniref:Papilin n=1 Tax=Culex quinquefasciatus TaxID=7176 RepID=B0WIC8_CULQU|nr:papilin [Culex quinquefasciatus]|eukprot:XP_001848462.1 papilin [Culex quinquefasciatus]
MGMSDFSSWEKKSLIFLPCQPQSHTRVLIEEICERVCESTCRDQHGHMLDGGGKLAPGPLNCLVLTFARATHKDIKSLNETLSSWNPSDTDPEDEDDEEVQSFICSWVLWQCLAEWLRCPLCKRMILGSIPICCNLPSDEEKRAKAQGWSSWTEWSTCSRSCDGGVAYQLRRCHAPHGCKGDAVRYKICNMQPCPELQDFRAHQCAAYDDVPYDGALLKWTPHYDYSEPCALTCRGRPQHLLEDMPDSAAASESFPPVVGDDEPSVIVQLSNRVQDGTRCRPGSLDMCIQGKCQYNLKAFSTGCPRLKQIRPTRDSWNESQEYSS